MQKFEALALFAPIAPCGALVTRQIRSRLRQMQEATGAGNL